MVTEHFEFAGWTDNLRLANDQVEEEISPGETAKHTEIWAVFSGIRLPHLYDEEGFAEAIDPYLNQLL